MVKSQRIRKQCKYSVINSLLFGWQNCIRCDGDGGGKSCRVFNGSHGERGQKYELDMLPVALLQMHDGVQELYRYDTVIDKLGMDLFLAAGISWSEA